MKHWIVVIGTALGVGFSGVVQADCEEALPKVMVIAQPEKGLLLEERLSISHYAKALVDNPEWRLQIDVTSTAHGTETFNLHVSEKWGKQALDVLEVQGVGNDRVDVFPKGESFVHEGESASMNAFRFSFVDANGNVIEDPCVD